MPTLECLGVFIAPGVPEDWIASGRPGEFYQLEPPSKDAAIHISVYSRNGRPLEDREARNVLGQFVSRALDSKEGQIRFLDEGPEQQRAFTQLTRPDGSGEVQEWLAACILWPETLLVCTFVASPGHQAFTEADRLRSQLL